MITERMSRWSEASSRRGSSRFDAILALGLAAALVAMVNYVAGRHTVSWDWTRVGRFTLSDRTREIVYGLRQDVRVVAFFQPDHELYHDVRDMLGQYAAVSPRVRVQMVDPDRELGRAKELAARYDVTDPNVVVFECGGRRQYVSADALAEFDYAPMLSGRPRRAVAFRGEALFSSALLGVSQGRQPVVYVLAGHGERQIDDFDERAGLSALARLIRRDNAELRPIRLQPGQGIPEDADALLVAGPRTLMPPSDLDSIRAYLRRSGRALLLLDPGSQTGLESLLEEWGAKVGDDRVVEKAVVGIRVGDGGVVGVSMDSREVYISRYGSHPITRNLRNVMTVLSAPRSVEPVTARGGALDDRLDKPQVALLAESSPNGWAESDPDQEPPVFDAGRDRAGPVGVAVAIEKGRGGRMDVEILPTRIVVVGDSQFAANGSLAGGNADFVLGALNWLLSRERLLSVAPKTPEMARITMSPRQVALSFGLIVVGVPAMVAMAGLAVWIRRRR